MLATLTSSTGTADRELLAVARKAVAAVDERRIISILKDGMVTLARRGVLGSLPFPEPGADRYSRSLVYSDAWERFTVIAMTWGPGQKTALHDHAGVWCVEVVVDGDMQVTNYELMEEQAGGRCLFERRETIAAPPASSGSLLPPFEHHVFGNIGSHPSHTVHIYGGPMNGCNIFEPDGQGWFQRRHRELRYDG